MGTLGRRLNGVVMVLALVGAPSAAAGQDVSWGFRGGVSLDPDAFAFGAHADYRSTDFPELAIVPSVDLSIGDVGSVDFTAVRVTGNVHWNFPAVEEFTPFALGGLSLYMFDSDLTASSTDLGMNLGGGLDFGALSTELWLSIGDIPDLSLWVAYTLP